MAHFSSLGLTSLLKFVVLIARHPIQILSSHPLRASRTFRAGERVDRDLTGAHFGENRHLEAAQQIAETTPGSTLDWESPLRFCANKIT
jgi:hypothetical protein